ncbi:MAG: RHS repeat-associated core domain-containing protein [Anaerolineae bacterium]
MRWLATDHLGSTSVTASENGTPDAELRYKPWGENRYTFGATPTKRRFTGQVLDEVAGGLYFYNARYYDPALGRFISADTIVPSVAFVQSEAKTPKMASKPNFDNRQASRMLIANSYYRRRSRYEPNRRTIEPNRACVVGVVG